MTVGEKLFENTLRTQQDAFLNNLQAYTLIDLGTIDFIDAVTGKAQVRTYRFASGNQVVYKDVEIIYPGNINGALVSTVTGSSCLIFIPYSYVPNIAEQKFNPGRMGYDKAGAKAMPISNGQSLNVTALFDDEGEFGINTDSYTVLFGEQCINVNHGDILQLAKGIDGSLYLEYTAPQQQPFILELNETGLHKHYTEKEEKVVWDSLLTAEGTLVETQTIPAESDDDTITNTLDIEADGSVLLSQQKGSNTITSLAVNTIDGVTVSVGKTTVTIDTDGVVTIGNSSDDGLSFKVSSKVSISADDDVQISSAGTLALAGKNVTINSTDTNSTVNINNGNLEVKK